MNISTEDLRELLFVLQRADAQAYRTAKRQLLDFDREIQKAESYLKLESHTASFSKQKCYAKNAVDRYQRYLRIISAIHSVSTNLPEEINTPQFSQSIENNIPRTKDVSVSQVVKRKTATNTVRVPQPGIACVIAGCGRPRLEGSDYCRKHESLAVCSTDKSNTCAYPSCKRKRGYAGSCYCQYHYQQEMYLSK